MQLQAHLRSSLQVAVWIQVMKYSFCCNVYRDKTLEDSTVRPVCKKISFFLFLRAFFLPSLFCFSACCPFYLSVCSLSFTLSLPLSRGTVWLVRPVIELPLFDLGSNRNCTLLTQLCLCVHVYISGSVQEGACHCVCNIMYIYIYIMYGCLQHVCV